MCHLMQAGAQGECRRIRGTDGSLQVLGVEIIITIIIIIINNICRIFVMLGETYVVAVPNVVMLRVMSVEDYGAWLATVLRDSSASQSAMG